jgi:hypothetical protein
MSANQCGYSFDHDEPNRIRSDIDHSNLPSSSWQQASPFQTTSSIAIAPSNLLVKVSAIRDREIKRMEELLGPVYIPIRVTDEIAGAVDHEHTRVFELDGKIDTFLRGVSSNLDEAPTIFLLLGDSGHGKR